MSVGVLCLIGSGRMDGVDTEIINYLVINFLMGH